jgi:hypothetical protein
MANGRSIFFAAWGLFWATWALRGALRGEISYRGKSGPETVYKGANAKLMGYGNFLLGSVVFCGATMSLFNPSRAAEIGHDDRFFIFLAAFMSFMLLIFVFVPRKSAASTNEKLEPHN